MIYPITSPCNWYKSHHFGWLIPWTSPPKIDWNIPNIVYPSIVLYSIICICIYIYVFVYIYIYTHVSHYIPMKVPVSWNTSSTRRPRPDVHRARLWAHSPGPLPPRGGGYQQRVISRALWFHHYKWWFNGDLMVIQWFHNGLTMVNNGMMWGIPWSFYYYDGQS